MKRILDLAIFVLAIQMMAGCMGLPLAERQKNATTEVSEKWSRDQTERLEAVVNAVSRSGKPGTITLDVETSEQGNGDQSLMSDWSTSIPGGVKLILWGLGGFLILTLFKVISTKSAAARTALSMADNALAKQVKKLEGRMEGNNLTADEKNTILSQLRGLERDRGKLK